jgi:L-rhamnose mutarotase
MNATRRYCLTLDLKNDPKLIEEYETYHKAVWPEIIKSIKDAGISEMEIYRYANRLFMIMEVDEHFSFEAKAKADADNPTVQRWEQLMWNYQQELPGSKPGEKWKLMENIFTLSRQPSSH